MMNESQAKESKLLEKRFADLSRTAYQRDIITYSDFLNLNEQNILHTMPKDMLSSRYISFGGYALAERQIAAFIPDALYLRWGKDEIDPREIGFPITALKISPLNKKFAEDLTHRDYLGTVLGLGIERDKTGDIVRAEDGAAVFFIHSSMEGFVREQLTRVRHTMVRAEAVPLPPDEYTPEYEEIKGTVASVRLDSLLSLAFSSSRTKLTGLIEGAKVFVNGRLITSNGYQVKEGDIISVRGMGKFYYAGSGAKTKKNRIYVMIRKYV